MSNDARPGCVATWHDTAAAYRKARCRCPDARRAEMERKAKYDHNRKDRGPSRRLIFLVVAGAPEFRTDPRRNCANLTNPDLMFPEYADEIPAAVAVCTGCPFRAPCAAWALDTNQIHGVWGGVSHLERRRTIREHRLQLDSA